MSALSVKLPIAREEIPPMPKGSLMIIQGSPLAQPDVIGQYMGYYAALMGERVVYVVNEATDVRESMEGLGMKLKAVENEGRWRFLEVGDKFVLDEDYLNLAREGWWSIIDNFSILAEGMMLELVRRLRRFLRETSGLHFLVITPELHSDDELSKLYLLVDGIFDVNLSVRGSDVSRSVRVFILKRSIIHGVVVPFLITKAGIIFEAAKRVV